MNFIQITNGQVKKIATQISKRWKFVNYGTYYNCIDTKTGQQSVMGGDKNFAHYHFKNAVESAYLKLIGEDYTYFDWARHGVHETNDRKGYVFCICNKIEELLCGFTSEGRVAAYNKLINTQAA